MNTTESSPALRRLFSELVNGANSPNGGFILNKGDIGLLKSLDAHLGRRRVALGQRRRDDRRARATSCAMGCR